MRLRAGTPVWLVRSLARPQKFPSISGRHDADVVIVGGGMTGAAVAQVFAEAGIRVIVVDAAGVGRGSTAASTALLMQETDTSLEDLGRRYGRARARRLWELSHEATRDLVATLRRLRIPCGVEDRDAIYYTTDERVVARLRKECERRRVAGFSASWMSAAALRSATGIAGAGAIRSTGNAQCDPYRACLGLLRAAARDGARIFERSRVRRIDRTRAGLIVRTAKGAISTKRVIVATGFATPAFKPLAGRFRMKQTYVLATGVVNRRQRERIGLGDVLLWDTSRPYHYARWTDDHRLLLGGNDQPIATARRHRSDRRALAAGTRRLCEDFTRLLPGLSGIAIEYAWDGLFAMTPDGLPFIGAHRRYPGHLFALGYGGNGMTFGFMAARLLLDAYHGIPNPDLELLAFNRLRTRRQR